MCTGFQRLGLAEGTRHITKKRRGGRSDPVTLGISFWFYWIIVLYMAFCFFIYIFLYLGDYLGGYLGDSGRHQVNVVSRMLRKAIARWTKRWKCWMLMSNVWNCFLETRKYTFLPFSLHKILKVEILSSSMRTKTKSLVKHKGTWTEAEEEYKLYYRIYSSSVL